MGRRMIPEHFRVDGRAKRQFESEDSARLASEVQQAQGGSRRRPYHAYLCGFCQGWHVGRKPPPGKRARYQQREAS